ncbi:hypothetical protein SKAU_G00353170 [Synaphobranchus kaupii]|uniref:Ig-like domain-containing protein n=1 Tax=Synaphobranchus kaupii TaxID=118154 RepID=A0A9Q1EKT6_SYNKA|nr:hypothetical protein SKAU_G00353170 [Synaphobranchus kaupii]
MAKGSNRATMVACLTLALCRYSCVWVEHRATGYAAYFGDGTKLTVLGKNTNISLPNVKILQPSKKEIKLKKRVTLVCVATDFYPDHVTITWKINNNDETSRSKMDESATWSDKFNKYSITSRLRVTAKQWHNSQNKFHCSVGFFNGNKTVNLTDTIQGIQYCGTTVGENKWSGNAAELSYILVLVKSALFALFLTTFVCKLKGSKVCRLIAD